VPEVPGVRTYELAFNDVAVRDAYRFTAGQFNMLYLPGIGEAAISISADTSIMVLTSSYSPALGQLLMGCREAAERHWPMR